jgi:hypothetical protein
VELGMQRELEQMVSHTQRTVSDVQSVEVYLAPPYDTGGAPRVIVEARRPGPLLLSDRTEWEWGAWQVRTFPPEVCEHFLMVSTHEAPA